MSGAGGRMRDLYAVFFRHHHLLPDSVGKQNPWVLFDMMASLNADREKASDEEIASQSGHLNMFYGK